MNPSVPPPAWSDLLSMMSERLGNLTGHVALGLTALLDAGRGMVRCAESALLVPHGDGENLRFLVSVNSRPGISEIVTGILVPCDRSVAGCVYSTGQLIAVANPDDLYPVVDQKTGLTTRVYLVVPVVDREEILGVVTFVNRPLDGSQEPFDQTEIEAATRVAAIAASGLRFYARLALQERLFAADLAEVARRFGSHEQAQREGSISFDASNADSPAASPLARALLAFERLSNDRQLLAADLLDTLASHSGET